MHPEAEIRQDVIRVLDERGVRDVEFRKDGKGHQVAHFVYRGANLKFHFPTSIRMNGRSRKNVNASLKRILRAQEPQKRPTLSLGAKKPPETLYERQSQDMGMSNPAPRHDNRDRKIWAAIKAGESIAVLSMLHNITESRVMQIFRQIDRERAKAC